MAAHSGYKSPYKRRRVRRNCGRIRRKPSKAQLVMSEQRLKVLVISNDAEGLDRLSARLRGDDYEVFTASTGPEGLKLTDEHDPAAIVMSVRLSGMDGYELCWRLREITDAVILFVSSLGRPEDIRLGLDAGADDYVRKPYSYSEIASRLRACLRRYELARTSSNGGPVPGKVYGLRLDSDRRTVAMNGSSVDLTQKEFEVLEFLIKNADSVVSTNLVLTTLWGPEYSGDHRLVKQYVYRLRAKLAELAPQLELIDTIRGSGYLFDSGAALRSLGEGPTSDKPTPPGLALIREAERFRAMSRPTAQANGAYQSHLPPGLTIVSEKTEFRASTASPLKRAGRRVSRVVATAAIAATVLSTAWVMGVSGDAVPGDFTYPVKRALEQARLIASFDAGNDVSLRLRFSQSRVDEIEQLVAQEREREIALAVVALNDEIGNASELLQSMVDRDDTGAEEAALMMEQTLAGQIETLGRLHQAASAEAAPAIAFAIQVTEMRKATVRHLVAVETRDGAGISADSASGPQPGDRSSPADPGRR